MTLYYTYIITDLNPPNGARYYIGSRKSSTDDVSQDEYMGSSLNSEFIERVKMCPDEFDKTIIKTFETQKAAICHEIDLHEEYDVDVNPLFYNKAKQRSEKFFYSGGIDPRKNRTFGGFFVTPWGIFDTAPRAALMCTEHIGNATINRMCKEDRVISNMTVAKSDYFTTYMVGMTSTQLGFRFVSVKKSVKQTIDKSVAYKGANNPVWRGWYLTPLGEFESIGDAAESIGMTKSTIYNWCNNNTKHITTAHLKTCNLLDGGDIGKSLYSVGFAFKDINGIVNSSNISDVPTLKVVTPWGTFNGFTEAANNTSHSIDRNTIKNYCKNNHKTVKKINVTMSSYLTEADIGKTYEELGFRFVPV